MIKGPGVVGPLDRLADVGPSEGRPADPTPLTAPTRPSPPDREALEQRVAKWHRERERFERRTVPLPAVDEGEHPGT